VNESLEDSLALFQVHEERSRMHQVELTARQGIGRDVQLAQMNVRLLHLVQKPRVQIDGHDFAAHADSTCKPSRDGAGTRTNLETTPARRYAKCIESANGAWILECLEKAQALDFTQTCVTEGIARYPDLR
jgi:hypothetical protein